MAVTCAHCGEQLMGSVNRCWRCGRDVQSRPGPVHRVIAPCRGITRRPFDFLQRQEANPTLDVSLLPSPWCDAGNLPRNAVATAKEPALQRLAIIVVSFGFVFAAKSFVVGRFAVRHQPYCQPVIHADSVRLAELAPSVP